MKKVVCNKKKLTHKQGTAILHKLNEGGYDKNPWRDEVSLYKCRICKSYHLSSKTDPESKIVLKGSYFDFQKEKWRNFLQNYSAKKAVISNKLKKPFK